MKALVYRNTKTAITNWQGIHLTQPRGYAYETDTHFVHIYGTKSGLWSISPGLTVSDRRAGRLEDWIANSFGAADVEESYLNVGETIAGVFRPGLFYDAEMLQGLDEEPAELRFTEQSLLLLIQRLDELLLFVEPTNKTLDVYGHKTRELLILACTEIEAQWKHYLVKGGATFVGQGFTTNDYVRLLKPLHLDEFVISLPRYRDIEPIRPFFGWSATPGATLTLPWYKAYNETKHDRISNFHAASLRACIKAVSAAIILFTVRFGPFRLYQGGGTLSAAFNHTFSIELSDCDVKAFYIPEVDITNRGQSITWGHADVKPRRPLSFTI